MIARHALAVLSARAPTRAIPEVVNTLDRAAPTLAAAADDAK
jgi:hypothetical protein